eukprot:m51a1_g1238 hypothetical protein (258) ;mRNA; f:550553-551619
MEEAPTDVPSTPPPPHPKTEAGALGPNEVTAKVECGVLPDGKTGLTVQVETGTRVSELVEAVQRKLCEAIPNSRPHISCFVSDVQHKGTCSLDTRVLDLVSQDDLCLVLVTEKQFETMRDSHSKRRLDMGSGEPAPKKRRSVAPAAHGAAAAGPSSTGAAAAAAAAAAATAAAAAMEEAASEVETTTKPDEFGYVHNQSCHRCKTRKPSCRLCPLVERHKFCTMCLERHHGGDREFGPAGCPVCTKQCTCAQCTRKK